MGIAADVDYLDMLAQSEVGAYCGRKVGFLIWTAVAESGRSCFDVKWHFLLVGFIL